MQPKHWINNGWRQASLVDIPSLVCVTCASKSVHLRDTLYAPDDAVDMEWHISVVDHKTTRLCIALSAHGSTRANCIRSKGRIQIRSSTEDAKTGRNTNTSILIATDMHATETMNQQWSPFFRTSPLFIFVPLHRLENKECPPQGHSLCTRRCSWHGVSHKCSRPQDN